MNKADWDQLYHLLRTVSNDDIKEERQALAGLTGHILIPGGYYEGLLAYLRFYGMEFLLPSVCSTVIEQKLKFGRVVEFGAGLGWLAVGMSERFGVPSLLIDKRKWLSFTMVADLETEEGVKTVLDMLKPDDLIVMCDFLHCIKKPGMVMAKFPDWNMAVLEYIPQTHTHLSSYITQLEGCGASPFYTREEIDKIFIFRKRTHHNLDPYILTIVHERNGEETKTKETAEQD